MSLYVATAAKGQGLYNGTTPIPTHDPASDAQDANGNFLVNPLEASAFEADQWWSFLLYLTQVSKAQATTINTLNTTVGPKQIAKGGAVAAWGAQAIYNWQAFG